MHPRDLPRLLAFLVIGGGDILLGVSGLASNPKNVAPAAYAKIPPPLAGWNLAFLIVGFLAVVAGLVGWHGPRLTRPAWIAAALSIALWAVWGRYIFLARHEPGVNLRTITSPVFLGATHFLLVPYRRKRDEHGR